MSGQGGPEPGAQQPHVHFRIEVPDDLQDGRYSNFLSVWHGPHDFTLDFAVTGQGTPEDGADGAAVVVPARVVSRIKVPLTMVQDVLRALAENVTSFEEAAGPIRKPGDDTPLYPPEDLS
ncbi:MAG: DUF3467 domain-containing protein [Acidimicrobiales bacterium]